ncbi:MAG: peroxiredoxin, partial [Chlamydiales bacterium]|nr:peroxiredoxin [Chlamydiales bacterium]
MKPAPQTGHPVPHFQAQDSTGEELTSEGLLGRPYILYFYPKDGTPGCTAEACSLRDHKEQFDNLDTLIIGISPDSA